MTMPSDMREHNRKLIEEFRAGGGSPTGQPLLLLTTVGARTGKHRTTPLAYMPDGDRLLVFASNGGAPRHPDWYHNVTAHPQVTVEMPGDTYQATAVVITGEDRDRLFAKAAEHFPFLTDYQAKVTRRIPVIALVRR